MLADVHSHILSGIDDGARDVKETESLLTLLKRGGVTHLALTPHYYPYKGSIASFLERRNSAFQQLTELPTAKNFTFSLGAEVYLSETLFNNESLIPLCYEGTRYMLTELEYSSYFTDATKYRLLRLIEDFGVIPVLAHIDRYPFLWKDLQLLEMLRRMGCCFQINLSSLCGFFSRHRALKLFKFGFVDFLGEDVHHSVLPAKTKRKILLQAEKNCSGFLRSLTNKAVTELFVSR